MGSLIEDSLSSEGGLIVAAEGEQSLQHNKSDHVRGQ
jgi:hypothetical protein